MSTDLFDLYEGIEIEFGKMPLVIFPSGIDTNGGYDCYWIVLEDHNGDVNTRQIVWYHTGGKEKSEAEGPSDTSCPMYFFELVPTVESHEWRERVKWFWRVSELSASEQNSAWDAYSAGVKAYDCLQKVDVNPHPAGSFNNTAWETGWVHAKTIR